jgi:hypothetical protein
MAAGGDVVGFELIATLYGALSESWLHYGLEKDCIEELGTAPIKERGRGNPGLWLPWLIAVYDLAD